jgi:hypothetical protein
MFLDVSAAGDDERDNSAAAATAKMRNSRFEFFFIFY